MPYIVANLFLQTQLIHWDYKQLISCWAEHSTTKYMYDGSKHRLAVIGYGDAYPTSHKCLWGWEKCGFICLTFWLNDGLLGHVLFLGCRDWANWPYKNPNLRFMNKNCPLILYQASKSDGEGLFWEILISSQIEHSAFSIITVTPWKTLTPEGFFYPFWSRLYIEQH